MMGGTSFSDLDLFTITRILLPNSFSDTTGKKVQRQTFRAIRCQFNPDSITLKKQPFARRL